MNNKNLGKMLIGMGIVTLITTIIDYFVLAYPLVLRSKEWVFSVTQSIADISIMPVLGMLFLLFGLYLAKEKTNEDLFNKIEKATGIISILFAVGFAVCALMYSISVGGVEDNIVSNLKNKAESAKEQINLRKDKLNTIYEQNKEQVDQEKYDSVMQQLDTVVENVDSQMLMQVNQTNTRMVKSTFKTIMNLLLFSLLHLYIFIKIFDLLDVIKYKILKLKKKPVRE